MLNLLMLVLIALGSYLVSRSAMMALVDLGTAKRLLNQAKRTRAEALALHEDIERRRQAWRAETVAAIRMVFSTLPETTRERALADMIRSVRSNPDQEAGARMEALAREAMESKEGATRTRPKEVN